MKQEVGRQAVEHGGRHASGDASRRADAVFGGLAELHREAGELLDAEFILLPPRRLKGISDPIRLLEVRDRGRAHPDRVTDPVCGMRMRTPDVAYRVNWGNSTYAFCSDICRAAFEEAPERFIPPPPQ